MKFLAILAIVSLFYLQATAQSLASCPIIGGEECGAGFCSDIASGIAGPKGCACPSGVSGDSCQSEIALSCEASFNSVANLVTENIPIAVTASFTNDELTVVVDSPLVTEREYTTVWVDESVPSDARCGYPGDHWTRSFDETDCHDIFTGVMPWAEQTANCGWALDNSDDYWFTYNADMIIQHHDFIDPFAGRAGSAAVERLTQHIVPLEVQFQKYIDVSTQITVTASVQALFAISRQAVDPNTKEAVIEVTTNLLHPYKLDLENILNTPANPDYAAYTYSIAEVGDAALCPDDPAQSCTQVFRITIDASTGCEISGLYDLQWDLTCQSADNCAIDAGEKVDAQLSILSEDFCAKVSVRVEIDGTLTSYESDVYSTIKTNFLYDQTAFFEAALSSPDATLTSSTIRTVSLVDNVSGSSILLYSDGNTPIPDINFSLDGGSSNTARFNFDLLESVMGALGADESKEWDVVARVDVTYEGVPGLRRLVLQGELGDKPMNLDAKVGITGVESNDDGELSVVGAASGVSASLSVMLMALLAVFYRVF